MFTPYHESSTLPATTGGSLAARMFWQGVSRRQGVTTMLDGYAGERLRLATFRHTPHVLTSDSVSRMHRGAALLSHHLEGGARVEQHGRHGDIAPGDFCLIDLSRPFRWQTGSALVQTLYLPLAVRAAVPSRVEVRIP